MIKIYEVNKEHPNILDQLNKKQSSGTILIYSDQCPHCISMKPQWEQMKNKLRNKPANIYEINSNDLPYINHPIKNIIDGFPMIVNVNNRNITPFNEERTLDNFVKFAESNILKMKPKSFLKNKTHSNTKNAHSVIEPMIKKKVRFQNNNNQENIIGDSLNLDDYITKKLPFLKVKKKVSKKGSKKKLKKGSKKKSKKGSKKKSKKRRSGKNRTKKGKK